MKSLILFYISMLLSSYAFSQEVLYRFSTATEPELGSPFGFKNGKGDIIIPTDKYPYIYSDTFDKIAFVGIKAKSGIYAIDRSENILFKVFIYDMDPDEVSEGLFRIIGEDEKIGFANMDGEIAIAPRFFFVYPFKNGYAVFNEDGVREKRGEYTKISNGRWGVINKSGKIVIPPTYENGRSGLLKNENKWYEVTSDCKLEEIK